MPAKVPTEHVMNGAEAMAVTVGVGVSVAVAVGVRDRDGVGRAPTLGLGAAGQDKARTS